jgi:hypothetical protein
MNEILGQLRNVRKTKNGYIGRCPVHDDRRPSLSISEAEDGESFYIVLPGVIRKISVSL